MPQIASQASSQASLGWMDVGVGTPDSSQVFQQAGRVCNHCVIQTHCQAAGALLELRAASHLTGPYAGI